MYWKVKFLSREIECMYVVRKLCDTDQMLANIVYHLSVSILLQVYDLWVVTISAE